MEPPSKRTKVARAPYDDHDDDEVDDDELSLSAIQFATRQDPMYQLDKKRAKSAFRLKSRFEHIFEKYEKDFEGVGDEIDLRTGEIIVNNGHLQSLDDEQEKSEDDEEDQARLALEEKSFAQASVMPPFKPNPYSHLGWQAHAGSMSSMVSPSPFFGMPAPAAYSASGSGDPAWQTPELPPAPLQGDLGLVDRGLGSLYLNRATHTPLFEPNGYGGLLTSFGRQPYRKLATVKDLAPRYSAGSTLDQEVEEPGDGDEGEGGGAHEDEDEDDILMAATDDEPRREFQPRKVQKAAVLAALATPAPGPVEQAKSSPETTTVASANPPAKRRGRSKKVVDDPLAPPRTLIHRKQSTARNKAAPSGAESATAETKSDEVAARPSKIVAQSSSTTATTTATMVEGQLPTTDDSSDCQSRRSRRTRKQPELYGNINWPLGRYPEPDTKQPALTPPPEVDAATRRGQPSKEPTPNLTLEGTKVIEPVPEDLRAANEDPSQEASDLVNSSTSLSRGLMNEPQAPGPSRSLRTIAEAKAVTSTPRSYNPENENGEKDIMETAEKVPAPAETLVDGQGDASRNAADMGDMGHARNAAAPIGEQVSNSDISKESETDIHVAAVADADADDDDDGDRSNSWGGEDGEDNISEASIELGEPIESEAQSPKHAIDEITEEDIIPESPGWTEFVAEQAPESPEPHCQQDAQTHTEDTLSIQEYRPPSKRAAPPQLPTPENGPATSDSAQPTSPPAPISEPQLPPARRQPITPKKRPGPSRRASIGLRTTTSGGGGGGGGGSKRKRIPLVSLVPDFEGDDDDDNLSVLSSSVARTPTSAASLRASFFSHQQHRGHHHHHHHHYLSSSPARPPSLSSPPRRAHRHDGGDSAGSLTPRHLRSPAAGALRSPSFTDPRAGGMRWRQKQQERQHREPDGLVLSSPLRRSVLMPRPRSRAKRGGEAGSRDDQEERDGGGGSGSSRAASPAGSVVRTPGRLRCGVDGFECHREFCLTCCR